MTDLPMVCTLTDALRQQRRVEVQQKLKQRVRELKPLQDGYAFRFEDGREWAEELLRMIELERECCPFLRFALVLEPNGGPLWLEVTGPSWTKAFLEAELNLVFARGEERRA